MKLKAFFMTLLATNRSWKSVFGGSKTLSQDMSLAIQGQLKDSAAFANKKQSITHEGSFGTLAMDSPGLHFSNEPLRSSLVEEPVEISDVEFANVSQS
jgi:hypothetical protein